VAEPAGYFVDVVRHHNDCWSGRVSRKCSELMNQLLAPTKVEASGRLIQEQKRRVVHQCAGEQHSLAFSRRESAKSGCAQAFAAETCEQFCGLVSVFGGVSMPVGRERRIFTGDDDVGDAQRRLQHICHGRAGESETRAQRSHVYSTKSFAKEIDSAAGWMLVEARDPAQRCLSRAVRTQYHPAVSRANLPGNTIENLAVSTDQCDVLKVEDRSVVHVRVGWPAVWPGRRNARGLLPPPGILLRTEMRPAWPIGGRWGCALYLDAYLLRFVE